MEEADFLIDRMELFLNLSLKSCCNILIFSFCSIDGQVFAWAYVIWTNSGFSLDLELKYQIYIETMFLVL